MKTKLILHSTWHVVPLEIASPRMIGDHDFTTLGAVAKKLGVLQPPTENEQSQLTENQTAGQTIHSPIPSDGPTLREHEPPFQTKRQKQKPLIFGESQSSKLRRPLACGIRALMGSRIPWAYKPTAFSRPGQMFETIRGHPGSAQKPKLPDRDPERMVGGNQAFSEVYFVSKRVRAYSICGILILRDFLGEIYCWEAHQTCPGSVGTSNRFFDI